jgi:hypothetical protein
VFVVEDEVHPAGRITGHAGKKSGNPEIRKHGVPGNGIGIVGSPGRETLLACLPDLRIT